MGVCLNCCKKICPKDKEIIIIDIKDKNLISNDYYDKNRLDNKIKYKKLTYKLLKQDLIKNSFLEFLISYLKNNESINLTHDNVYVDTNNCISLKPHDDYYYLDHPNTSIYQKNVWRIGIIILKLVYELNDNDIDQIYKNMINNKKYENNILNLSMDCIGFIECFYDYKNNDYDEFINILKDCFNNDINCEQLNQSLGKDINIRDDNKYEDKINKIQEIEDIKDNNIIKCPNCNILILVEKGCNKVICNSRICSNNTFICVKCSSKLDKDKIDEHFLKGIYNDCIIVINK